MKTIQMVLVMLLVLLAGVVKAQVGRGEIENFVEARVICADEDGRVLIVVEVAAAFSYVVIAPNVDDGWGWFVGEVKSRRFWIDGVNESVIVNAEGVYTVLVLGDAEDCAKAPQEEAVEMVECLGMSHFEFVAAIGFEPVDDFFVVDGDSYAFHDNLSFFVPIDAVWEWDLYVEGVHVLTFAQSEETPCAVTAIYPQSAR